MLNEIRAGVRMVLFLLLLIFECIMPNFATAMESPKNIYAEAEVLKFVSQWLELSQDNKNFNAVMAMYADTVDFYKLGRISNAAVATDKKKYIDRWPKREHKLVSLKVHPGDAETPQEVSVTFHYVIRNEKGMNKEGNANSILLLTKKKDSYVIISEKDATTKTTSFADSIPSNCGDITTIKRAIAEHLEYYGDVNLDLKCKNPKSKAETLICADNHLFLMYKLNSMAEVYAVENATKRPIEHKTYKSMIPACKTKSCICDAFVKSTNDSLGGESPYYVDE